MKKKRVGRLWRRRCLSGILTWFVMLAASTQADTAGDYRSNAANFNWSTAASWETYNGSAWVTAGVKPGAANNVLIRNGHVVTLTVSEMCKDLHVSSGNVNVAAETLYVHGSLVLDVANALTATGASSLEFHGNAPGVALPANITALYNLYLDNTNGVALNSDLTVGGTLTVLGGAGSDFGSADDTPAFLAVGDHTLTLNGALSLLLNGVYYIGPDPLPFTAPNHSALRTTAGSSLVFGSGSGSVNLPRTVGVLNNLTCNSAGGLTVLTNLTVGGTLTLNQSMTVTDGTLTLNGPAIAGTPTLLTVQASASLAFGGSAAGVAIPSSISSMQDLAINNPNGVTLGSDLTLFGTLTLSIGTFAVGAHTLALYGSIVGTPANLATTSASSLELLGEGPGVSIPSSVTALSNLTILATNGVALNSDLTIAGTLTIRGTPGYDQWSGEDDTPAFLAVGAHTLTMNGPLDFQIWNPDLFGFGGGTWQPNHSALHTTAGSSLVFGSGSGSVALPLTVGVLNNLTCNSTGGLTVLTNLTVGGTLTLNQAMTVTDGTLTLNGPAIAGTPTLLTVHASASLAFGGSAAGVAIPSSISSMQDLTINNPNGVTLGSDLTVYGTLTLSSGTFAVGAHTLALYAPIAGAAANLATTSASSLSFLGNATGASIPGSVTALSNLTIETTSGVALNSNLTISGTLTIRGIPGNNEWSSEDDIPAFLAVGAHTLAMNGPLDFQIWNPDLFGFGGGTWQPNHNALHTTAGSSLVFGSGSGSVELPRTVGVLNNLTCNSAGGLTVLTNLTVGGTLTLNQAMAVTDGTLTLNGPAIAGTPTLLTVQASASLAFGGSAAGVAIPGTISWLQDLTINNPNVAPFDDLSLRVFGTLYAGGGRFSPGGTGKGTMDAGNVVLGSGGGYRWEIANAVGVEPSADPFGLGTTTVDFGDDYDFARSVTLQADGKIVVAGCVGDLASFDFGLARFNADSSLDTSFGTGGKVSTDFGGGYDMGYAVALQTDGKIVVAGRASGGGGGFALARYSTNGVLDASFGSGGKITTSFGADGEQGYGLALQSDGKILVAGYTASGANKNFALARYSTNGVLDGDFGSGGKVTTDFGSNSDIGHSVAVQTDGKILVAGQAGNGSNNDFALARYSTNGVLDATFGSGGKATTDFGGSEDDGYSVVVQPDGKIVAGGAVGSVAAGLVRYETNGVLDATFGSGGKATTTGVSAYAYANLDVGVHLALQSDGKILVAGSHNAYFALARYTTNGLLDPSFDADGLVTTDLGDSAQGFSVAVQPDGRILVAGAAGAGFRYDFALVRYKTGGSLDAGGAAGEVRGWDLLNVAGTLTVNAGHTVFVDSLTPAHTQGNAANFDSASSYAWRIATAAGGVTWNATPALDLSGFSNPYAGTFALSNDTSNVYVTYTPGAPSAPVNLLLPANGGVLAAYTSQYSMGYAATNLTDGIKGAASGTWISTLNPGVQGFVYTFSGGNYATLSNAVIYNYGQDALGRYSKTFQIWGSPDGTTYTLITNGTLAASTAAQSFNLRGSVAKSLKLVITSGYVSSYWELGEFEVHGTLGGTPDLTPPLSGTAGAPATAGALPIVVTYAGASDSGGSGLAHVELWYKKGAAGTWRDSGLRQAGSSGSFNFSAVNANDTYYFDLVAQDGAGNRSAAASGDGDGQTVYTGPLSAVNLLLPANGGVLAAYTSQYSMGYAATNLTDGIKGIASGAWISTLNPGVQGFVHTFSDGGYATLSNAVIYNYGQDTLGRYSKTFQIWSSPDGTTYTLITNGTLAASTAAQSFNLRGSVAKSLKLVITSGYVSDYWDLGEFEVHGTLGGTPDLTPPLSGTAGAPATAGALPIVVTYAGASDSGGSGLAQVELWYKKGAAGTWRDSGLRQAGSSGSFNFPAANANDTYYFDLVAQDGAGNRSAAASGDGDGQTVYTGPLSAVNLLLPANGGVLAAYTSQYSMGYAATNLTDGIKGIASGAWISTLNPGVQGFVYTFSDGGYATLSNAVIYNYGQDALGRYSKTFQIWGSTDGTTYTLITNGTLAAGTAAQSFNLRNIVAKRLRLAITSGYSSYWELGEFEVHGTLGGTPDLTPPVAGTASAPATTGAIPVVVTYAGASDSGGSGLAQVELWYKRGSAGIWRDSGLRQTATSGSFSFTAVNANDTYYFAVVAADGAGNRSAAASADGDTQTAFVGPVSAVNLLLPANGGVLAAYTSQYSSGYAAANLTDGIKGTASGAWISTLNPGVQGFVYTFSDGDYATLSNAVIYNYGQEALGRYSKTFEIWGSADGTTYALITNGTLAAGTTAQSFNLRNIVAKRLRLAITSGYSSYWDLGEFEIYGTPGGTPGGAGGGPAPGAADAVAPDRSDDGLPDDWRTAHFGGAAATPGLSDAGSDPDGDGMSNLAEFTAGTDPNVARSRLAIVGMRCASGGVWVTWTGGTGAWQYVECASVSAMTEGGWATIETNPPPTPVTDTRWFPLPAGNDPRVFRVRAGR